MREYGIDLCWTPMILAKEFNRNAVARDSGERIISISILLLFLKVLRCLLLIFFFSFYDQE